MNHYQQIDDWVNQHFDEQVLFLQELVRVPTDTPPGNNTPHALRTAQLLKQWDMDVKAIEIPDTEVKKKGLQSITNLIVRREYGEGKTIALNAHGDVVPPGEGWTHDPYGAEIVDGKLYGRASAVSKCDFSTFTFAVRALESLNLKLNGAVELHFTYDEEFGGELGPDWLLKNNLTKPDLMIAAGFSYQVITAHNGCLQLQVTVNGKMAHAAIPQTGV
ncbi:MAG: M20/M25/M40 family metallo-hydrolase, partial [Betaproteobacteria bacterium]|nr:M20/M25/M40 family metallo-hydrolase [Betaproteobacteria bacterium]